MFSTKVVEEKGPELLAPETLAMRVLDKQAYEWLGDHYRWYDKVRKAKKGDSTLFHDATLEEQMLATRASLSRVTESLQTSIVLAYNHVVEGVAKGGKAPEGWPPPLAMPDRNNPPPSGAQHDTLIVAFQPIKFLTLAKAVREKGKGIPYYTDGLVKKLWLKVIGFYCDPSHWDLGRLGYLVERIAPDASLSDVTTQLSPLRGDVDALTNIHQPFRFGRTRSAASDPNAKTSVDDLYKATDEEMVADLYLQHLILQGFDAFVFRYYLTLMSVTGNPRVMRALSHMFLPLLRKSEEIRQQFQGSFLMERDKMRLRSEFQAFYKQAEAKPPSEVVTIDKQSVQRLNLCHRWLDQMGYARAPALTESQRAAWTRLLSEQVVAKAEGQKGHAFLLELLSILVAGTQNAVDGKLKAAATLREFAYNQEKLTTAQINRKKRAIEDAKRKILRKANKFKADKAFDVVQAYEGKANAMEAEAMQQITAALESVAKRKEGLLARVEQLEKMAKEEGEQNTGRSAANMYQLVTAADTAHKVRAGLLPFLAQHIQEEKDESYHPLYRFLFGVVTDLTPTEKMLLRKIVATRMKLEEQELAVSEEEVKLYQQRIVTAKTEINVQMPGVLDLKMVHGPVQVRVEQLLDMGLNLTSLNALLHMPLNAPNKPPTQLPVPMMRKLLALNQLMHPIPEHDLLLPNVEADAPLTKRINFNRLAKLP